MLEIERIGKMRKRLGLTQKELATLSGVSQSLIAKIESGKIDPAYSKVVHILAALESRQKKASKTAEQIMTTGLISVGPSDSLEKAIALMRAKDISQLPVFDSGKSVGSLSDSMIVDLMTSKGEGIRAVRVGDVMAESYPVIPANSPVEAVTGMLQTYRAVLIGKNGKISGIITKADLLKAI
jgi:predicted transcriptional regulator